MKNRNNVLSATFASIALGAALAVALPAAAQDSSERLLDRHVSVKFESARLGQVIKAVMSSLNANYVVSNDIKDSVVTVDLTDVPMRNALAALGRIGDVPMTYTIENGIYYFVRREGAPPDVDATQPVAPIAPPASAEPEVVSIHLDFSDAGAVAKIFGGTSVQVSFQNFGLLGFGRSGQGAGAGVFSPGGLSGSGSGSSIGPGTTGFGSTGSSGNGSVFSSPSGFGQFGGPGVSGTSK